MGTGSRPDASRKLPPDAALDGPVSGRALVLLSGAHAGAGGAGMKRILLFASKTGYQVREFASAAEALGVELVLATDRCHILEDPWGDRAIPVPFDYPE